MGFFASNLKVDVNSGLIGQWKFDEQVGNSAIDSSIRGGHAVMVNSPVRVDGIKGKGLRFNGTNQYTVIPAATSPVLSNSFTISLWTRLGTTSGSRYVMTKRATQDEYAIVFGFVAGKYELYGEFFTGVSPRTALTTSIADTNWHLITFTYNGATVIGYLDENQDVTSNKVFSIGNASGLLRFATSTGGVDFYNGTLDDVRIYNRPITPEEVKILYRARLAKVA